MQKILLTFLCLILLLTNPKAQQLVQPGDFKYISLHGPVMYYFNDAGVLNNFKKDLDSILYQKRLLKLPTNTSIEFSELKNVNNIKEKKASVFPQLSFYVVEYSPALYRKQFSQTGVDSNLTKDVLSVFIVEAILQTSEKKSSNSLVEIFLKKGISNGMGLVFNNLHLTGKGFSDLLKTSLNIVLDSTNEYAQIEMKAAPAYTGDNFIMAATKGLPKIQFTGGPRFTKFKNNGAEELLRWDEQRYRDIVLAGKNKTTLSDSLYLALNRIRRVENDVLVFLQQDARDVVRNKNYRLEMPAHIYQTARSIQTGMPTIETIDGNFHTLICETDTIARFNIESDITDPTKKIFFHYSTNGIDSTTATPIYPSPQTASLKYLFVIKGIIRNHSFTIKTANSIREIEIDGVKTAFVIGDTSPDKMVVFNNNISPALLNEILLIAYNSFLQ